MFLQIPIMLLMEIAAKLFKLLNFVISAVVFVIPPYVGMTKYTLYKSLNSFSINNQAGSIFVGGL